MRATMILAITAMGCAGVSGVGYEAGNDPVSFADSLAYCDASGGAPIRLSKGFDVRAAMAACQESIDDATSENVWSESCWTGETLEVSGQEFAYAISYSGAIILRDTAEQHRSLCAVPR